MNKDQNSEIFSTEKLLRLLTDSHTLESFLDDHGENLPTLSTSEYLDILLEKHHLAKQEVIKAADLDRSTGYQIFNGYRNPRRNAVLRIAIAMQLSLDETQHLLKIAQRGELYAKNRRDAVIIYCIHRGLNLINTEILLDNIGEKLLK